MKWATITEAAQYTRWSEYSIRQAIKTGRFPHIMMAGRYLIDLETIDECLRDEATANAQKAREQCRNSLT